MPLPLVEEAISDERLLGHTAIAIGVEESGLAICRIRVTLDQPGCCIAHRKNRAVGLLVQEASYALSELVRQSPVLIERIAPDAKCQSRRRRACAVRDDFVTVPHELQALGA